MFCKRDEVTVECGYYSTMQILRQFTHMSKKSHLCLMNIYYYTWNGRKKRLLKLSTDFKILDVLEFKWSAW